MKKDKDFYESKIKGKSSEALRSLIKRLYSDMARLKRAAEPFFDCKENREACAEIVTIRERIDMAKRALAEVGGEYTPSAVEKRDEAFRARIPHISKIELSLCLYLGGVETKTFKVNGEDAIVETEGFTMRGECDAQTEKVDKRVFLDAISGLHIGEWRRKYAPSRFGIVVCDGVYWHLNVCFSDGSRTLKIKGTNSYPYNFESLLEIFDMEML